MRVLWTQYNIHTHMQSLCLHWSEGLFFSLIVPQKLRFTIPFQPIRDLWALALFAPAAGLGCGQDAISVPTIKGICQVEANGILKPMCFALEFNFHWHWDVCECPHAHIKPSFTLPPAMPLAKPCFGGPEPANSPVHYSIAEGCRNKGIKGR